MNTTLVQSILFLSSFVVGAVFINISISNNKFYKNLLSFSGAFLFGLTVLHFIPEVFHEFEPMVGIWILLGFSFQIVIEFLTQGLDHGHYHPHGKNKLSVSAIIGLFVHSIFEASPLAVHEGHSHTDTSEYFLWGLVLHKIPVAIFLGTIVSKYFTKKIHAYLIILAFSLMAPIGLLLAQEIEFLHQYHQFFMAFVVGIFLYISTTILYEINENHSFNTYKFIAIIIGFTIAILSSLVG
ncbi:MAG: zinc and cadmium transporter [Glaciecola sp.]|jgi:zinc and cadmium transporter